MFKNEKYIGVYKYKDIRIEGGIPALIDKELWEKVQIRLGENVSAPARGKAVTDYLLSQKLFCGHCGRKMDGASGIGRTGQRYHYYSCYGRKALHECDKKNIKKDVIERAVTEQAVALLNRETIEYLAEETVKANETEMNNHTLIPALKQKISDIEKSITRLIRLVEEGADSPTLAKRLSELEKEKKTVEKQLLKEENSVTHLEKSQVIFWLEKFTDGDIEDFDFRRRIIDMLVNCVYVYDNPDGDTDLDIVFNLTPETKKRITLKDIKSGASVSHLEDCVPPKTEKIPSGIFLFCAEYI